MLPVKTSMKPKQTINNPPTHTDSEFKRPKIGIPLHFTKKKRKNIQYIMCSKLIIEVIVYTRDLK